MSSLEPLRGLLQVVEAFIARKRSMVINDAPARPETGEDELLGDLSSFLEGASLDELLALRHRICVGGLRALDQLLKSAEG
jgi:hypothetical protein